MYTTKDVASAFINSKRGWAVAEQFEAIYDNLSQENLSEQNHNALKYIKEDLTALVRSKVLSQDSNDELVEIVSELVNYFEWNS